jgi:hypothetical protein
MITLALCDAHQLPRLKPAPLTRVGVLGTRVQSFSPCQCHPNHRFVLAVELECRRWQR